MGDTVVGFQQCAVQCFDRFRIGEVDRVASERVGNNETFQLRAAGDQAREIVRRLMLVAQVKLTFGVVRFFRCDFQAS